MQGSGDKTWKDAGARKDAGTRKDAGETKAPTGQYKTGKAGKLLKYRNDIIRRDRKKVKPAMRSRSIYV
jgi:hypothetical protein